MTPALVRDGEVRRALIADTVIALLADSGRRGVTHRAVDAAAGLPAGSTSYYYRTREALLTAAADRLAQLDLAAAEDGNRGPQRPIRPGRRAVDGLLDLLTQLVHSQITGNRERTLARYELSLEAIRSPHIKRALTAIGARFTAAAEALLATAGSADPTADARALIAVAAGLVYESTVGAQHPYTRTEIASILHDVLAARLPL